MFARAIGLILLLVLSACSTVRPQGDGQASDSVLPGAARGTASEITLASARSAEDLLSKGLLDPAQTSSGMEKRALFRARRIDWGNHEWLSEKLPGEIRVHSLPVGAGSCHLIECPGPDSDPLVVDCGSTGGAQMSPEDIEGYLRSAIGEGSPKVVISHGDADHSNFLPRVLPPPRVRSLWLGGAHAEYPAAVLTWANAVRDLGDHQWPRVTEEFEPNWHNDGRAVEELACGEAKTFALTVNSGSSKNANSLMLSVDHGDFRIIFSGDAEGTTERAAMENFPEPGVLVSTVVVSSHHGAQSEESNHAEWIAATQPLVVVHSAGTKFGHPKCPVVKRFQDGGSLLPATPHDMSCGGLPAYASALAEYNTHESGAVVVTSDASLDSLRVECFPEPCSD